MKGKKCCNQHEAYYKFLRNDFNEFSKNAEAILTSQEISSNHANEPLIQTDKGNEVQVYPRYVKDLKPLHPEFVAYNYYVMKNSKSTTVYDLLKSIVAPKTKCGKKSLTKSKMNRKKVKARTSTPENHKSNSMAIPESTEKSVKISTIEQKSMHTTRQNEDITSKISFGAETECLSKRDQSEKDLSETSEVSESLPKKQTFESIPANQIKLRRYNEDRATFKLMDTEVVVKDETVEGKKIAKKSSSKSPGEDEATPSHVSDEDKRIFTVQALETAPTLSPDNLEHLTATTVDFCKEFSDYLNRRVKELEDDFESDELIAQWKVFSSDFKEEINPSKIRDIILTCNDNYARKIELCLSVDLKQKAYSHVYLLTLLKAQQAANQEEFAKCLKFCVEKTNGSFINGFLVERLAG